MKNLLFIFPLLFLSFLFSCNEDPIKAENKIYPTDSIDVNDDGIYDYYIESETLATMDYPSSVQSNRRLLIPINGNEIYYTLGTSQSGQFIINYLHAEGKVLNQEFVGENSGGPNHWEPYYISLVSIGTVNTVLDPKWKLNTSLTYTDDDEFYVGLKLKNVTPTQIAWICLKFNLLTGAYTLVDKAYTTDSSLVMTR